MCPTDVFVAAAFLGVITTATRTDVHYSANLGLEDHADERAESATGTQGDINVTVDTIWQKMEKGNSRFTKQAKWRVCGMTLAYSMTTRAYFVHDFTGRRSKWVYRKEMEKEDAHCSPLWRKRLFLGMRVKLNGSREYGVIDASNCPQWFELSWVAPILYVDKRNVPKGVAKVGRVLNDVDMSDCCQVQKASMACFRPDNRLNHHCTTWIYWEAKMSSCRCSYSKSMVELVNLEVIKREFDYNTKENEDAESKMMEDVLVEGQLWVNRATRRLGGFRFKDYPANQTEKGTSRTIDAIDGPRLSRSQVIERIFHFIKEKGWYDKLWSSCQTFAAWMLAMATQRPDQNKLYYSFMPTSPVNMTPSEDQEYDQYEDDS